MIWAGVAAGQEQPRPGGMTLNGRYPCYGLYRCAGGGWMSLGALEPKFWAAFCAAVQRPDLLPRQFGGPEDIALLAEVFAGRTREKWTELMAGHDCCCEPVLDLNEAVAGELAAARKMVLRDGQGRAWLASPFKLGASPNPPERPAPDLGQHTRQVLAEAGFAPAEVEELLETGVAKAG
jgi:crotonobetainyl-CoA:carnitine CoA-transferase CaiB-like acyl-CoA transferase